MNGILGHIVISTSVPPPRPQTVAIASAIDSNGNPVHKGGSTISISIIFQVASTPGSNPITGFECSLDTSSFSTCATTNPGTVSYNNLTAGQAAYI